MDEPKRIQRRRVAGWKLPPGAICVSRPSKFGNPYELGLYGRELALKLFKNSARGIWDPSNLPADFTADQRQVESARQWRA